MGVLEQTPLASVNGGLNVRVKRTANLPEYITYDRAMRLADQLEAEGWTECAAQIRKDVTTVRRLRPYGMPNDCCEV
jgi:hypothetical protein